MNKLITTSLAIALAATVSAPAIAGGKNFHQRLENQEWRIEQGVESGTLTHKEAKALRKEHKELHKVTKRMLKDGRLSKRDRHILDARFDEASARIYRLKRNDRYAYRDVDRHHWNHRVYVQLSEDRW